jgi:single-strand DNA-binding protein
MRSVNKVILLGHVTRDPELRQTTNGHPIATFSIATNRRWITSTGGSQEATEFHDLVAWGKLAEICNQHIKKGTAIYVEGRLHTRKWEMPDGNKRHKTEIVITELNIISRKNGEQISEEGENTQVDFDLASASENESDTTDLLGDLDLDSEDLPS